MTLPLQDKNNPLYGLLKQEQCLKLLNWQKLGLQPWQIFSLSGDYTSQDIKKAYHQLAIHFHPDKNPDISQSPSSFDLIKQASDYLHYGLKSASERILEYSTICSNPFYAAFGEFGFAGSNVHDAADSFQSPFYFDEFGFTHIRPTMGAFSKKKTFSEMSFAELVAEIKSSPIPEEVVAALKRLVLNDKTYLTAPVGKGQFQKNLLYVIVEYGDIDFFKWLIEQGADPFVVFEHEYGPNPDYDVVDYAIQKGRLDVVQYLFQRFGAASFYEKSPNGPGLSPSPLWRHLYNALDYNEPKMARFLLNGMGYASCLGKKKFDKLWFKVILTEANKLATVDLMLEYNLLSNLQSAIVKAVEYGEIAAAQKILEKKSDFNIKKLFKIYIESRKKNSKEFLDWMSRLLGSHPIAAADLDEMLFDLSRLLNWRLRYAVEPSKTEGYEIEKNIALTLIPKLFALLHACKLPSANEIGVHNLQTLSLEKRRGTFHYAYTIVAERASYETLAKLLTINFGTSP